MSGRDFAAIEVSIAGRGRFPALRDDGLVEWTIDLVRELVPEGGALAVRLVGDRTMRGLNLEYRDQDKTTDVLSFPGLLTPEGRQIGDLVISVPQAELQAGEQGHRLERELRILILHGLLHCLGHDHESDRGEMNRLERRLRKRFLPEVARR